MAQTRPRRGCFDNCPRLNSAATVHQPYQIMNRRQRRKKQAEAKHRGAAAAPTGELLGLAVSHHQAGRLEQAAAIYRDLLRSDPNQPDALHLSGVIALQGDRHDEALDLIGRAIAENPAVALYHRNMALTLEALDRTGDALIHFSQAAELEPGDAENHLRLAHALTRAERPADAALSFQHAIDIGPQDAETHTALAIALTDCDDLQGAGENFALAVERAPDAPFTLANLGRFHADNDDPAAAEPLLRRAMEIDPDFYEAVVELGALMNSIFRATEALPLLTHARALRPDSARARSEFATALQLAGRLEQAHDEFRALVRDRPDDYKAHDNLGSALSRLGRFDDAIRAYDDAVMLNPDYRQAYANRALMRLTQRDFAGGWRDYLYRESVDDLAHLLHREILPDDLSGRRIALHRDQGLGDEIFFLRFAPMLKRRGALIAYNPDAKIADMIGRLDFIDEIMRDGWPAGGNDLQCSIGDLPFLLGMNSAADIPPPLELAVLPERDDEIIRYLAEVGPPPYIGCTWRAGVQYRDRLSKMSSQTAMAEALRPLAGTVLVLQRNPEAEEIEVMSDLLGHRLVDTSHYNDDLEGMLALLGRIDEYVCVSNTNTHLRAARGQTSRVLVPLPADYRWMGSGDESPWFPGTRLYRESAETGWNTAFENLGRDLKQAVGTS
jgi:tetratricopeptide (TPR) repeat protein